MYELALVLSSKENPTCILVEKWGDEMLGVYKMGVGDGYKIIRRKRTES